MHACVKLGVAAGVPTRTEARPRPTQGGVGRVCARGSERSLSLTAAQLGALPLVDTNLVGHATPCHATHLWSTRGLAFAGHNFTTGVGCTAGPNGTQADHGYEDRLFAGRVQRIIQSHGLPHDAQGAHGAAGGLPEGGEPGKGRAEGVGGVGAVEERPLFVFWSPHNVHTSLMVPEPYASTQPFNSAPMGVNSISFGSPRVRCTPMGRTCGT